MSLTIICFFPSVGTNLQAFVIFEDWSTCCRFVEDHLKNPVCVSDCTLTVHFVFQRLIPEDTQVLDSLWDYTVQKGVWLQHSKLENWKHCWKLLFIQLMVILSLVLCDLHS